MIFNLLNFHCVLILFTFNLSLFPVWFLICYIHCVLILFTFKLSLFQVWFLTCYIHCVLILFTFKLSILLSLILYRLNLSISHLKNVCSILIKWWLPTYILFCQQLIFQLSVMQKANFPLVLRNLSFFILFSFHHLLIYSVWFKLSLCNYRYHLSLSHLPSN